MKPLVDSLKESVPYGDHDMHYTSAPDVNSLRVFVGVRCLKCEWHVSTSVNVLTGIATNMNDIVARTFCHLIRQFCKDVPPDCATASLLSHVSAVHDR